MKYKRINCNFISQLILYFSFCGVGLKGNKLYKQGSYFTFNLD